MNDDVKPEVPVVEPKTEEVVTDSAPKPGEKTDPALLLEALHKERERRKLAEAELAAKNSVTDNNGAAFSEEGKVLESKITRLEQILTQKEESDRLKAVQSTYPAIKDKEIEFEEFRNLPENSGMRVETAAKAFLIENGLLEQPQVRKGLEKETGGTREPVSTKMSPEEIDDLRNNNFREYVKRLKNGTLEV